MKFFTLKNMWPFLKDSTFPLLFAVAFYFAWSEGGLFVRDHLLKPLLTSVPYEPLRIFMALDYGRLVGRISFFIWTLILLMIAYLAIGRWLSPMLRFSHTKSQWRPFLRGMGMGISAVTLIIGFTLISKSIELTGFDFSWATVLSTFGLYFLAMILTASCEELAFRGFILGQASPVFGTHCAVLGSALVFGIAHVYGGWVYGLRGYAYDLGAAPANKTFKR